MTSKRDGSSVATISFQFHDTNYPDKPTSVSSTPPSPFFYPISHHQIFQTMPSHHVTLVSKLLTDTFHHCLLYPSFSWMLFPSLVITLPRYDRDSTSSYQSQTIEQPPPRWLAYDRWLCSGLVSVQEWLRSRGPLGGFCPAWSSRIDCTRMISPTIECSPERQVHHISVTWKIKHVKATR